MQIPSRRWLLAGLVALLVVSAPAAAPAASARTEPPAPALRLTLPEPTGPYPVGSTELHLVDAGRPDPWVAGRPRELMVSVWYPASTAHGGQPTPYLPPLAARAFAERTDAQLGLATGQVDWAGTTTHARTGVPVRPRLGGHPVVVFSPGGAVPRAHGTMLATDLASRGYVVVTIDHTYETPEVEFPGGRVEAQQLPDIDPTELNHRMIETRVRDSRFVLDQLAVLARGGNPDAGHRRLPAGLGAGIDLSRVGMFGHSAGGFTSAETMLVDRRLDAGVNMDGSLAYSFSANDFGDVVDQGLDRPFLLMGAGQSSGTPHTHQHARDWAGFWANSTGWKLDLYVAEGEHFTFTDHQALLPQLAEAFPLPPGLVESSIGTVDPDRIVGSLKAYLGAFFDQHLRGQPQPLLRDPSPRHPDVAFVRP
ncbi:alpha/beta hydrolase family protein [Plantactinospora endophytica]|uniref:Lipase n=1 Tax=Plantactinospora endophytica TaxID=673535 RepID=A0ABQ4DX86_9ACTN|nr:lipase [Plantactinospora endophytica]GIG87072.1 lipase [Plantactinospora endophytica]